MISSDLKVEGVKYDRLLDLDIVERANTHGICKLVVAVSDDFDTKTMLGWSKTPLTVKADKDIIFGGLIDQPRRNVFDRLRLNLVDPTRSIRAELNDVSIGEKETLRHAQRDRQGA